MLLVLMSMTAAMAQNDRCVRHQVGRVDCRSAETQAFVYSWPVTPDMAGQTLDVSSLTLGVSVFPPIHPIARGQSQVSFEIKGAQPGQTIKLMKKLVQAELAHADSADMCCIEEHELTLPEARSCTQSVVLRPPLLSDPPRSTVPSSKIAIEKSCAACPAGAACRCKVTVRNVGTQPISSAIQFRDETRITGGDNDGEAVRIASVTPDGNDWTCSSPTTELVCEIPGPALAPASARSVVITLDRQDPKSGRGQRLRNCASIRGNTPGVMIVGPRETCVALGGDILVRKSGDTTCRLGEQCAFEVTIANSGKGAYVGPLMLADELSLGRPSGQPAEIVSIEPPLGCASEPRSLPFACRANVVLPGGQSRTHRIVVRLPSEVVGDRGDGRRDELAGRNCFAASAVAAGTFAPDRTVLSLLKISKPDSSNSAGGEARACADFSVRPRCPGDLVLRGSQCVCPAGTERQDDSCRPSRSAQTAPQPRRDLPPEQPLTCPGDLEAFGRPGNQYCDCPEVFIRRGDECLRRRTGPCPGDLKRFGPPGREYCDCREGLIRRGDRCLAMVVPPLVPVIPPQVPLPCPGDLVRYGSECRCPEGLNQRGASCVAPQQVDCPDRTRVAPGRPCPTPPPKRCPYGQVVPYNVECPRPPPPKRCPNGQVVPYNVECPRPPPPKRCPNGQVVPYNVECPRPPPPKRCPNGQVVPYNVECPRPPPPKRCPNGQVVPYNVDCPRPPLLR